MFDSPIRRSQLIAPFGVGALFTTREGVSIIAAGLDNWFDNAGDDQEREEEFYIEEWRLQRLLGVDSFRLPPDFRMPNKFGQNVNVNLKVPFLRFPTWHFCQRCRRMEVYPLTERGRKSCNCQARGAMVQVPIIAICDRGHVQDFPWAEWAHSSQNPDCAGTLSFRSTGSGGLRGLMVRCTLCGKSRSLENVLSADPSGDETFLSSKLDSDALSLCGGVTPWLGDEIRRGCGRPLRGALRSSTNVYYAQQTSAIYLPRSGEQADSDLVDLMSRPPISQLRQIMGESLTVDVLRGAGRCTKLLEGYTNEQISAALAIANGEEAVEEEGAVDGDDAHTAFRRREFEVLRQKRRDSELVVTPVDLEKYESELKEYFSSVSRVEKLRETRVLRGFARVYPENDMDNASLQRLLRAEPPEDGDRWLPAYIVSGEGIFLQLNEERLHEWEQRNDVVRRIRPLQRRYEEMQSARRLRERAISPRFVLAHTLAHLLINRLTFESGYSAASLRERLFLSTHPDRPMAGLLVYTAAGDSEGTMGGLVRLGKPSLLEPVFRRAVEEAGWCGADPVCMEAGEIGGQGPAMCNISACHNCALLPETACEEFNRFLDRGLVTGTLTNGDMGYFNNL